MNRIIRTCRLTLRPLRPEDARSVAALIGDYEVTKMLARAPYPYRIEDAETFIARVAATDWIRAIDVDGAAIGTCGINPKLGYWLGRPYWDRGYMSEAAAALVDAWFATEPGDAIEAGHFAENLASRRVLERIGFTEVGRSALRSEARGCDVEHVDMILTRADRETAR